MSDFTYNLQASSTLDPGEARCTSSQIEISPVNNNDLYVGGFLDIWADDAAGKVPFDIQGSVDGAEPVTVEVTEVENKLRDNTSPELILKVSGASSSFGTTGVLSLELGLKAVSKDRPCGGYEAFVVTQGGALCRNSCVFKNTVTGREFAFNNVDLGTFDFDFEGPNERYEIIWGPPQGCDNDKVKILNRVSDDGKTLYLEDYGNSPDDIDFNDLIIQATYGSYEWDGGDEDTVYYNTTNNGALCKPGYVCNSGQCVPVGEVQLDDILLTHIGSTDTMCKVRAGDYMTRLSNSNTIPVTRGLETFYTTPANCSILDSDAIALYRPSDTTVYQLTGQQFKDAFCYNRAPLPVVNGARLYRKSAGTGINGETFGVEISAPDNGDDVNYNIIVRVVGKVPASQRNTTVNVWVAPNREITTYLETGDSSAKVRANLMGSASLNIRSNSSNVIATQSSTGATITRSDVKGNYFDVGWEIDGWNGKTSNITWNELIQISGNPDFNEPFTREADLSINDKSIQYGLEGSNFVYPSGTFTLTKPDIAAMMVPNTTEQLDNFGDEYDNEWEVVDDFFDAIGARNDWNIGSGFDMHTLTGSFTYASGTTQGQTNEQLFANFVESFNGFPVKDRAASVRNNAHPYWFVDIISGLNSINKVGNFNNIGNNLTYEWTMNNSTTVENGGDANGYFNQAVLQVDVFATNRAGNSEWVSSNYVKLI